MPFTKCSKEQILRKQKRFRTTQFIKKKEMLKPFHFLKFRSV